MAINAEVLDTKYFNEFKNGTSFGDNPGDFTRNLAGLGMEKIRVLHRYKVRWEFRSGFFDTPADYQAEFTTFFTPATDTLRIIRNDGGDFRNEGLAIGQACFVEMRATGQPNQDYPNRTILQILESELRIDMDGVMALPYPIQQLNVIGQEPLTAAVYDFGLIENDENFNTISKVTLKSMAYYSNEVGLDTGGGRSTAFVDMIKLGEENAFVSGSARIRYAGGGNANQEFEIEHTFTIHPWYLEGELNDLLNDIAPELYDGTNSPKYVHNAEFRQALNDPNVVYPIRVENVLGSVGWYNESFNGFNNLYEIVSVAYEEDATAANADGILIAARTKITITVSKTSGAFVNGDTFGVYISYLPLEEDYQNTIDTNLLQNFIYDRALNTAGAAFVPGDDFIQELSAVVSSGDLVITCVVEYDTPQKEFLSGRFAQDNAKYVLGVQVGDNTLPSTNSDRIIIKADVRDYDDSPDIPGLISLSDFFIYPHNEEIGVGEGFSNMIGWNEDGLVATFKMNLDLNKQAFLNNLRFSLIAYNDTTEEFFILDDLELNLAGVIVSGGVQQINIDQLRGYVLKDDDQFNQIEVKTGSQAAGIQTYDCVFSQKITWQDWIENLAVDSDFFDAAEPNDNLNLKASNYSDLEGYSIRMAVRANLSGVSDLGVSGLTDYLLITPSLTIRDYGVGATEPPEWTGTIKTFRQSNNQDLSGAILVGENTLVVTTWVNSGGPVPNLDDIWAIHRLEPVNDPGFNIEELSSLNDFPDGQALIPIPGNPLLKVELVSGNVVTSCLIDGNLIDSDSNYNISARIHKSTVTPTNFKTTSPAAAIKDTSGTVVPKTTSP